MCSAPSRRYPSSSLLLHSKSSTPRYLLTSIIDSRLSPVLIADPHPSPLASPTPPPAPQDHSLFRFFALACLIFFSRDRSVCRAASSSFSDLLRHTDYEIGPSTGCSERSALKGRSGPPSSNSPYTSCYSTAPRATQPPWKHGGYETTHCDCRLEKRFGN